LLAVIYGSIASTALAAFTATNIGAATVTVTSASDAARAAYDMAFSLALLGAGYLVGLSVGARDGAWPCHRVGCGVPILTTFTPQGALPLGDFVYSVWLHKVRFIGAGTIAVAAIWTLTKLAGPVVARA